MTALIRYDAARKAIASAYRVDEAKKQSSKWQRLAMLVDDATFERALAQAHEKNGELTTAALLREIREIVTPAEVLTEPDINVIASELIRDVESASRKQKLETVIRL